MNDSNSKGRGSERLLSESRAFASNEAHNSPLQSNRVAAIPGPLQTRPSSKRQLLKEKTFEVDADVEDSRNWPLRRVETKERTSWRWGRAACKSRKSKPRPGDCDSVVVSSILGQSRRRVSSTKTRWIPTCTWLKERPRRSADASIAKGSERQAVRPQRHGDSAKNVEKSEA